MAKTDALKGQSLFDLTNKVALVTGGGSGIGLMAAQALAANGAKVYVVGRTQAKLDTASSYARSIIPLQADITTKDGIKTLIKEIESKEQHLNILVNNAGISSEKFPLGDAKSATDLKKILFDDEKATFEDWRNTYNTNVASVYFTTLGLLPLLQKSTEDLPGWSASIINITSISGLVKSAQNHFGYNASKAAAEHLTRMMAAEFATTGLKIRVNSIAPGVFPSEMTAGESGEDQKSHIPKSDFEGKVPANRPGKDEDMAQSVLFVATNQYFNGQNVVVDGGYELSAGM